MLKGIQNSTLVSLYPMFIASYIVILANGSSQSAGAALVRFVAAPSFYYSNLWRKNEQISLVSLGAEIKEDGYMEQIENHATPTLKPRIRPRGQSKIEFSAGKLLKSVTKPMQLSCLYLARGRLTTEIRKPALMRWQLDHGSEIIIHDPLLLFTL